MPQQKDGRQLFLKITSDRWPTTRPRRPIPASVQRALSQTNTQPPDRQQHRTPTQQKAEEGRHWQAELFDNKPGKQPGPWSPCDSSLPSVSSRLVRPLRRTSTVCLLISTHSSSRPATSTSRPTCCTLWSKRGLFPSSTCRGSWEKPLTVRRTSPRAHVGFVWRRFWPAYGYVTVLSCIWSSSDHIHCIIQVLSQLVTSNLYELYFVFFRITSCLLQQCMPSASVWWTSLAWKTSSNRTVPAAPPWVDGREPNSWPKCAMRPWSPCKPWMRPDLPSKCRWTSVWTASSQAVTMIWWLKPSSSSAAVLWSLGSLFFGPILSLSSSCSMFSDSQSPNASQSSRWSTMFPWRPHIWRCCCPGWISLNSSLWPCRLGRWMFGGWPLTMTFWSPSATCWHNWAWLSSTWDSPHLLDNYAGCWGQWIDRCRTKENMSFV